MARFFYIARDKTGKKITGAEDSNNQEEVISRLQARDLLVVSIMPEYKEGAGGFKQESVIKGGVTHRHYRISGSDLALFCRQLATLLGAGITIMQSLSIISKQVSSIKLQNTIKDMEKNMEQGLSLHEAMAKHVVLFSELWINLVESGEASGNLAVVLERLARYLERNAEFKKKIISSLIYPALLIVASTGALLFLTIKIIPTFTELFRSFNVKLPFLTQVLILTSEVLRKYVVAIFGGLGVSFFLFRRFIATDNGRRIYEKFKFNLPVFGDFFRSLIVERFCSEMSTLLESGVPILYSLEIAEHSVGNLLVADIIRGIKDEVREGRPLSQPLEKSGFFEPMVVQMVSIGEEIGELPNMFKRLDTFYQEYLDTFLGRFASMFEPIVLIVMGAVIGTMVIGMFLPIFEIARIGGNQ